MLQVNVQRGVCKPYIVEDSPPVITLVKKSEIAPRPLLSPEDLALEQTLSMLCSFLSLEDFMSFLDSAMFRSFAQRDEAWVAFEIGLYQDHTKTLQLYPEREQLIMADEAMTGVFDEQIWKGVQGKDMVAALQRWMHVVSSR